VDIDLSIPEKRRKGKGRTGKNQYIIRPITPCLGEGGGVGKEGKCAQFYDLGNEGRKQPWRKKNRKKRGEEGKNEVL